MKALWWIAVAALGMLAFLLITGLYKNLLDYGRTLVVSLFGI